MTLCVHSIDDNLNLESAHSGPFGFRGVVDLVLYARIVVHCPLHSLIYAALQIMVDPASYPAVMCKIVNFVSRMLHCNFKQK
jgi:hypothetical protein